MANKKLMHNIINKTRKSFDFRYQQAIIRNKNQTPKTPHWLSFYSIYNLLRFLTQKLTKLSGNIGKLLKRTLAFKKKLQISSRSSIMVKFKHNI